MPALILKIKKRKGVKSGVFYANLTEVVEGAGWLLHDSEQQIETVFEDANKYTDDQVNTIVNNAVNEAKSYTDMKFETLSYAIEDV